MTRSGTPSHQFLLLLRLLPFVPFFPFSVARLGALCLALLGCGAALAIAAPAEPSLGNTPGPALALQLRSPQDPAAAVGPAPTTRDAASLSWKAAGLVGNAKGAISFRIRLKPVATVLTLTEVPKSKPGPRTIASWTGSGGAEWFLHAWECPYAEAKPTKEAAPQGLDTGVMDRFGEEPAKKAPPPPDLDEQRKFRGLFACQVGMKLTADGMDASSSLWEGVFEPGAWHHVTWSWSSVEHALYLDGRPCGGSRALSRMQPGASPEALLRLFTGVAEIADLRVYRRALSAAEAKALATARPDQYLPGALPLALRVEWGRWSGRAVLYADTGALPVARLDLAFRDATGRTLRQASLSRFPDGLGEMAVQVTENEAAFAPGTYHVEATALAAAGKTLGTVRSDDWTAAPPEPPVRDFIGCRAGAEDRKVKILPPFTPIQVRGDVLAVAMREHKLDRTGFPAGIVAGGAELLEGPVALHVRSGGKTLAFSAGPGLGAIRAGDEVTDWTAESATPDGHRLAVAGHLEYDGLLRFDLTLTPAAPLAVDGIDLRIPLRPETVRILHSVGTGFIHRFAAIEPTATGPYKLTHTSWVVGGTTAPARPATGAIFDSYLNHEETYNPQKVCSFVHVGNYQRGLSWFIDNDAGWLHKTGVPNMELVATPEARYVRLNLVAGAATLAEPLTLRFYLLANPFKPLPADWRTWSYGNRRQDRLQEKTSHMWWWEWAPYCSGFKPFPDDYAKWVGKFKPDPTNIIHAPFINFGTPGGSGLFTEDMQAEPYTWKVHNTRAHRDFLAYWIDRSIREIGIRGTYVDEPYCQHHSYNLLAGDTAYVAPDGTRRLGFRWLEGREYFRRLKQLYVDRGITDTGGVWVHTSHWKGLPYFTFIDISMDGEWPAIWVHSFYDYVNFYASPELSRGYISGQAYGFVGMQMFNGNFNPRTFPEAMIATRSFLGCTLPYGVVPLEPSQAAEWHRANQIAVEAGVFEADALTEIPPTAVNGLQCGGFVNRRRDLALVYVLAHDAAGVVALTEFVRGLPLAQPGRAAWNAETGLSLCRDAKFEIAVESHDFAVILVRGVAEPQPSRPAGLWLAATFDRGFEPDTGGGLAPVRVTGKPATAPGKAGQALRIGGAPATVAYPVVPQWVAGALEFDLRLAKFAAARVLGLRHMLNVDLETALRGDRRGLLLTVREGEHKYEQFAEIAQPSEWSHVRLAWRSGQYELSVNGKAAGTIAKPAEPQFQDADAPAFGLLVGSDAETAGEILVDNVALLGAADAQPEIHAWAWGKAPTFAVAANFAEVADRYRAGTVRFTLTSGGEKLGAADAVPWRGFAQAKLVPAARTAVMKSKVDDLFETKDKERNDLGDELETATYELTVELLKIEGKTQTVIASRKVTIKRGLLAE